MDMWLYKIAFSVDLYGCFSDGESQLKWCKLVVTGHWTDRRDAQKDIFLLKMFYLYSLYLGSDIEIRKNCQGNDTTTSSQITIAPVSTKTHFIIQCADKATIIGHMWSNCSWQWPLPFLCISIQRFRGLKGLKLGQRIIPGLRTLNRLDLL